MKTEKKIQDWINFLTHLRGCFMVEEIAALEWDPKFIKLTELEAEG